MHIVENISYSKDRKKVYRSVLLRESYREGYKVKKRTIANLSHAPQKEIDAIKLALKYKDNLTALCSINEDIEFIQGSSFGAIWTVYMVAKQLGIEKVLGTDFEGKLAMWQIIARVIDHGSRLSAIRFAQEQAVGEVLDLHRGFDENDLYSNLAYLSHHQKKIEIDLFANRRGNKKPEIFLYDVTSSYLEGVCNAYADWGYNRDKKKGKKQIVIGLLCDEDGEPVSVEVFKGNTNDTKTFGNQVKKAATQFGCKRVTFVGDRGMIKSAQIETLSQEDGDFYYITAITKPQIETLEKNNVIQYDLFDQELVEVVQDGVRYILRLNPFRAQDLETMRIQKRKCVEDFVSKKKRYLHDHPKAMPSVAQKEVDAKIRKLKLHKWLSTKIEGRDIQLIVNSEELEKSKRLDGCYVIKTNVAQNNANKRIIHDRYRDLALVEKAFRNMKTVNLELRPIFVRKAESTCGHVLVVMLSYLIIRRLYEAWVKFDLTVEEGLKKLNTISVMEAKIKGEISCVKIPKPRETEQKLLDALEIYLPEVLPRRKINVVTRKKLQENR